MIYVISKSEVYEVIDVFDKFNLPMRICLENKKHILDLENYYYCDTRKSVYFKHIKINNKAIIKNVIDSVNAFNIKERLNKLSKI